MLDSMIESNALCLHFLVGKKPKKVNFDVSNPAETTAGIKALEPGKTVYGIR